MAAQFVNGELSTGLLLKDPHDAEFTHNIDINDARNRHLLTRGSSAFHFPPQGTRLILLQIHKETGAAAGARGV